MISGLSAAYHAAKDHIKKRITAKFKSRDVRIVPDPERQTRSPFLPPTDQPAIHKRKVDEPETPVEPYLSSQDEEDTEERTSPAPVLPQRRLKKADSSLSYFSGRISGEDEKPDQKQTEKDTFTRIEFELRELKRDAKRLRRKAKLQQYEIIEKAVKARSLPATLAHIKEFQLVSLEHHAPVIEALLQSSVETTETTEPPPPPPATPSSTKEEPIPRVFDKDDEEIPEIPTEIHPGAVQQYHDGKLNLVVGDIARLKQEHGIIAEAVICPAGGMAKLCPATKQVLDAEPLMSAPDYLKKLNQLKSGQSALMPTAKLAEQGVKYVVHPITPRPGEPTPHNLLLASYFQSITHAMDKGVSSIALPVIGDEQLGLNPENACNLALNAVMHCLKALPEGQQPPKIYFVFPDQPEFKPQIERMQQKLEYEIPEHALSSSDQAESELPVVQLGEQEVQRLMGKILPRGHAFTTRGKVKWMNGEVEKLCKMMYKGEADLRRYDRITEYLRNASMKMYDLTDQGIITPAEFTLLNDYFEQRIELLEIYERKSGKRLAHKMLSKDVTRYNAESRFPSCHPTAKMAFVNHFDAYCDQAFKAHHLRAVPPGPNTRAERQSGKIARPVNGAMHAARTALWVKAMIHLYQKHGNAEALQIREEEIPMIQMAAIYNSSSAHASKTEREREGAALCKHALMDDDVDETTADQISSAIPGKNKPFSTDGKSIVEKVLHDAVALEKLRYCEHFELEKELDFVKEFPGQTLAMEDVSKMSKEVAKTIRHQQDLMKAPTISRYGSPFYSSPPPSFSVTQKEQWEHAEHPYSTIEISAETHSRFIDDALNDV